MRAFAILLLSCGPFGSFLAGQDLHFQHINTSDGLSDNGVTCLFEDDGGYIWIGTENGLDRYDGSSIQHIDSTNMPIASVLQDRAGILWVATKNNGLLRIDPATGARRTFGKGDAPGAPASEKLTALYDLNDTTLLIGSREITLMFLDKRTFTFTYWSDSTSMLPSHASARPLPYSGWCHSIIPVDKSHLWIGLLNFHISLVVDVATGVVHNDMMQRAGSETQTYALLHEGLLYTSGWQNGIDVLPWREVLAWSPRSASNSRLIEIPEEVNSMLPWRGDRILASTRQLGLYLVDLLRAGASA